MFGRSMQGSDPGYAFYSARHMAYPRIYYPFMYSKDFHRLKDSRIGQRVLGNRKIGK